MHPFGETVLAWRLERGLTQAQLARAARLPRPNLSAIERGDREVTLRTLRALALALGVRPGVLADGTLPGEATAALSRAGLERVARAVANDLPLADPRESTLAQRLRATTGARLAAVGVSRRGRSRTRAADQAYLLLRASEPPTTVASLVDRVAGAAARR